MLRLTDNAKAAITGITSQSGLPETGGVRLSLTTDTDEVERERRSLCEQTEQEIEEAMRLQEQSRRLRQPP